MTSREIQVKTGSPCFCTREMWGGASGENKNDARSLACKFWALFNAVSSAEASEIARRISLTPVGAFSFPDTGEAGVARGTSTGNALLDAGTPGVVTDTGNSERKVVLLQAILSGAMPPLPREPRGRRTLRSVRRRDI